MTNADLLNQATAELIKAAHVFDAAKLHVCIEMGELCDGTLIASLEPGESGNTSGQMAHMYFFADHIERHLADGTVDARPYPTSQADVLMDNARISYAKRNARLAADKAMYERHYGRNVHHASLSDALAAFN